VDVFRLHRRGRDWADATGASLASGRWHTIGTPVIYTAQNIALALLETLVHAEGRTIPPRAITRITIPDSLAIEHSAWIDEPASQTFGDQFVARATASVLKVPSIVVEKREFNFVLNPAHPSFKTITAHPTEDFEIDPRFILFP